MMCGFTFTVFLSFFQLLPTAPFRILDLGGSTAMAGLFLGVLTYASALSAPITGALADRIGKRVMLLATSVAIAGFSVAYALSRSYWIPLVLVFFHGLFWSGLLSASSAYMTEVIPESRRAEGIGYWGMATMLATATAPWLGLQVYKHGWGWLCAEAAVLNLVMAAIAWKLPPDSSVAARLTQDRFFGRHMVEWRVAGVALALFLCSFGYGGIMSFVAVVADRNGVTPRSIFFTAFALTVLVTRLFSGRLADRVGHRRVLLPCLALTTVGLTLTAFAHTRLQLVGRRLSSSAWASATSTRPSSATCWTSSTPRAAARPSAASSPPSTPASARARSRSAALAQRLGFSVAFAAGRGVSAPSRSRTSCGRSGASCSHASDAEVGISQPSPASEGVRAAGARFFTSCEGPGTPRPDDARRRQRRAPPDLRATLLRARPGLRL